MISSQSHVFNKDSSKSIINLLNKIASNNLASQYNFSLEIQDRELLVEGRAKKFEIVKVYFRIAVIEFMFFTLFFVNDLDLKIMCKEIISDWSLINFI